MDEGLSPAELAELPPPDLRKVVLLVLREVQVSNAKISETMTTLSEDQRMSQAEVDTAVDALCKRGLLVRFEDGETILYRVNLRRRSGGQVIQNILQALGLKSSDPSEKTTSGDTGLRRGGNRFLPSSIWDALGETKKSTSEEAETVLDIFSSPAKPAEIQPDKREVTLAHSLWDAVTTDEEKAAEEAKESLRSQISRRNLWDALDEESDSPSTAPNTATELDANPKFSVDVIRAVLSEPVPEKKEVEVVKAVPPGTSPLDKLADITESTPDAKTDTKAAPLPEESPPSDDKAV
jgi:hypothetical protein